MPAGYNPQKKKKNETQKARDDCVLFLTVSEK